MYNESIRGDNMIKNIVFDIGNVLVTFYPQEHFLPYFKDEGKTNRLCEQIFTHEAWEQYDQGVLQLADLYEIYDDMYPEDIVDTHYILDHWLALMKAMPDTFAYMKELKKQGYHVYLLSNISKDSADCLKKKMPFFNEVDGGVLSYEVKMIKPTAGIYEELLKRYQLVPQETIFFDDNKANIEQARKMGIFGILFIDLADAKKQAISIIEGQKLC